MTDVDARGQAIVVAQPDLMSSHQDIVDMFLPSCRLRRHIEGDMSAICRFADM
jgi:hypothetical protein